MRTLTFALIGLAGMLMAAEPTEEREWTSTAGSKLTAKAKAIEDGAVVFEGGGRVLKVPLEQLVEADRAALKEHFKEDLAAAANGPPVTGLPHEQGKNTGPIDAGGGSSYWVYLPKTMSADTKAPVLFWTGSGNSGAKQLDYFRKAAELTGTVVAASVESKNGPNAFVVNNGHTVRCLEHMEKSLPIDVKRVYFTGGSGGGATAFFNASLIDCAGAMPFIGYIPNGSNPKKQADYFVTGGGSDYNRYHSAFAAKQLGKSAIYRPYPGAHKLPESNELFEEGLIWLYTRYVYGRAKSGLPEVPRFEARMLDYVKEQEPWRRYFWANFMTGECKPSAEIAREFSALAAELGKESRNVRYVEGLADLMKMGEDDYADIPGGSLFKHTTDPIRRSGEKLAEEYAGVPEIEQLARDMAGPTQGK